MNFEKKLKDAKSLVDAQGRDGNWNYDHYMHGLFNGMEIILSLFEERNPNFKDAPEEWLKDKPSLNPPISIQNAATPHIESADCWCGPELAGDYESEGGTKHYVHKEKQ